MLKHDLLDDFAPRPHAAKAPAMTPEILTARLKEEARRLGFDLVGAAAAVEPPGLGRFRQWLADGFAGQMGYLAARAAAYEHPAGVLPGARSLLMLASGYRTVEPMSAGAPQGSVARYAWGQDYHDVVRRRLRTLAEFHRRLVPGAAVRGVVDTAPLLERDFARLAGLGWIGKNTLLIHRQLGSWLTLAALLTSETLVYDEPAKSHCGTCRRCLDACPTGALVEPYRLDARRCLAYLTIESRESLPEEFRGPLGSRLFGCDACQEVCPWNGRASETREAAFAPREGMNPVDLIELIALDEAAFDRRFRGTALMRAGRRGLLCRAALLLGHSGTAEARAALVRRLAEEADPEIRREIERAVTRFR
jgi:epoxyqueuosine reductase